MPTPHDNLKLDIIWDVKETLGITFVFSQIGWRSCRAIFFLEALTECRPRSTRSLILQASRFAATVNRTPRRWSVVDESNGQADAHLDHSLDTHVK